MAGAQALVHRLRSEGVDAVSALPGVRIMAAFDAIYELHDDIRLIQKRHWQASTSTRFEYLLAQGLRPTSKCDPDVERQVKK